MMESETGYFVEGIEEMSWACREMQVAGPSGSLPQPVNASTTRSMMLCNGSSSSSPWSLSNDTDVDAEMPRFNRLSLVKTVVLLAMFVVAFAGNVATLTRMYRMRRRHSTINLLITHTSRTHLDTLGHTCWHCCCPQVLISVKTRLETASEQSWSRSCKTCLDFITAG